MKNSFNRFYRRSTAQHGLVHLLFLLLAVLGLTMWGASELQLWSQQRTQDVEKQTQRGLEGGRRSLIDYAVVPPPRIYVHSFHSGRYNAVIMDAAPSFLPHPAEPQFVPFRYFNLPCPDGIRIGTNEGMDSVPDYFIAQQINECRGTTPGGVSSAPGYAGNSYGRLPWRSMDSEFLYQRGLGGVDYRDGYGERLWYTASRNLFPLTNPTVAINPHALLRLTTGWLTAVNNVNGGTVANRIAAAVVAPGRAGGHTVVVPRVPIEVTDRQLGSTQLAPFTRSDFVQAYLSENSYDAYPTLSVFVNVAGSTVSAQPYDDRFVFLTAEDLLASGSEGIEVLENAPVSIYDRVAGNHGELGAVDMLQFYLRRNGYLPAPALLVEENAHLMYRPSGVSRSERGDVTIGGSVTVSVTIPVGAPGVFNAISSAPPATAAPPVNNVIFRLSDLPPVYLQGPLIITTSSGTSFMTIPFEPLPPYGAELAEMNTFNHYSVFPTARLSAHSVAGHVVSTLAGFEINAISRPLTAGVNNANSPFPGLRTFAVIGQGSQLLSGQTVTIILSDAMEAYVAEEELSYLITMPGQTINQLPPYALKVLLPAGTRLTLVASDFQLRFPANVALPPGSSYNPVDNTWTIGNNADTMVEVLADADKWASVDVPVDGFPAQVGDVGFLPVGRVEVGGGLSYVNIPNTRVDLSGQHDNFSYLTKDTSFLVGGSDLVVLPFPPPGHPTFSGSVLVVPLLVTAGSEFDAPAHSRLVYPRSGQIFTGDSFSFPEGTFLHFAPGAVITAEALPDAVLPGGIAVSNIVTMSAGVPVTIAQELEVTLVHGGVVAMRGTVRLAASGDDFLDNTQKLFDIELTGPFTLSPVGSATLRQVVDAEFEPEFRAVLNPLLGILRRYRVRQDLFSGANSSAPALVLQSQTYTEARFSSMERIATSHELNDELLAFSSYAFQVTVANLGALYGSGLTATAFVGLTTGELTITFDENTRFYLPPNTDISLVRSSVQYYPRHEPDPSMPTVLVSRVPEFVLPPGTGFYRGGAGMTPGMGDISVVVAGGSLTVSPQMLIFTSAFTLTLNDIVSVTRNIGGTPTLTAVQAEHHLLLLPDSDMVYGNPSPLITGAFRFSRLEADSVVDVFHHQLMPPSGDQRIKRVSDGTILRSRAAAQVYLAEGVALRLSMGVTSTAPGGATLRYLSYVDYVASQGASAVVTMDITLAEPQAGFGGDRPLFMSITIHMPAGSYLHIPPGEDINFYPDIQKNATVSPAAVAVVPDGLTASIDMVSVSYAFSIPSLIESVVVLPPTLVAGPAYFVLDMQVPAPVTLDIALGAVSAVAVSIRATSYPAIPVSQLFLNDYAYLVDSPTIDRVTALPAPPPTPLRDLYVPISPESQIDMLGYVNTRADNSFYSELMPLDTRQLFADYPMLYMTAPECRLRNEVPPGPDCAQGEDEGLVFHMEQGEEYLLSDPYRVETPLLITAARNGVQLSLTAIDMTGMTLTASSQVVDVVQITPQGEVRGFAGTSYIATDYTNNRVLVNAASTAALSLRLYMGEIAGTVNLLSIIGSPLPVASLSYFATAETLTLYGGGYVGEGYEVAQGGVSLLAGTELTLGYGSRLADIQAGETLFGPDSMATVDIGGNTHTLNLNDYVYAGNVIATNTVTTGARLLSVSLAAALRNIDVHGNDYYGVSTGTEWIVYGRSGEGSVGSSSVTTGVVITPLPSPDAAQTVTVQATAVITMQQGYLWQGYVPQDSRFAIAPATGSVYVSYAHTAFVGRVTSSLDVGATITASRYPNTSLYLRIHSTVNALNLWGSGLERPESIDADSRSYAQQGTVRVHGNYGSGRHTRHDSLQHIYASWYRGGNGATAFITAFARIEWARLLNRPQTGEIVQTIAVEGFAGVMQGTVVDRHRESLQMLVAVYENGTVITTTADWTPRVVHDTGSSTVTIPGYVRVNSGSSNPLRTSPTVLNDIATVWTEHTNVTLPWPPVQESYTLIVSHLSHEWLGRHNTADAGLREDAIFSNLQVASVSVTVVFNMPHIDIAGTGVKFRLWPSAERMQAHPRGSINLSPGAPIIGGGGTFNQIADIGFLTARAAYVTIARAATYNAPLSEITIDLNGTATPFTPDYAADVTGAVTASLHSDWFFYMDTSYHTRATGGAIGAGNSPLPSPLLQFGSNFRIRGPAAIVPPFGGKTEQVTRLAYAERSYLINRLLPGVQPLSPLYDQESGDCRASNDCPEFYNNSYWFPLVGGVLTFEGLEVDFQGTVSAGNDDLRLVLPQPQAEVELADGSTGTLYAGSILYPHRNIALAAAALPAGGTYELHATSGGGDIIAHVDVSPVQREINYELRNANPQALDGGVFNYAPVRGEVTTTTGVVTEYIVEPLGFTNPPPHFDFDLRALARNAGAPLAYALTSYGIFLPSRPPYLDSVSDDPEDSALCSALGNSDSRFMGCYERPTIVFDPFNIPGFPVAATILTRDSQNPLWYRYGGVPGYVSPDFDFSTITLDSSFEPRGYTYEPLRVDGSFNRGAIANVTGIALYTTYYSGGHLYTLSTSTNPSRYRVVGVTRAGSETNLTDSAINHIENTDMRFGNPASWRWTHDSTVSVQLGVSEISGSGETTIFLTDASSTGEIELLRLPHRIAIPDSAVISLGGYVSVRYPTTQADFFVFPTNSTAYIVNLDLNSWLSAHPHIGLYQQGMQIESQLGGGTRTIQDENDSYRTLDLSDKAVVHYQRSESSQARAPLSAVPIHTNVWLRLPEGGYILGTLADGVTTVSIQLGPDSMVNPIYNTYLARPLIQPQGMGGGGGTGGSRAGGALRRLAINQYAAPAQVLSDLRLVRPALTLPVGTRLVAGSNGGVIRNVQAAVIFSLTPLDVVQCPTGDIQVNDGMSDLPVVIDQQREGVSEDRYPAGERGFGFGHPCAWLDDPENTDGDRVFVYRSRRRWVDENVRLRLMSNDRTYLLGGKVSVLP